MGVNFPPRGHLAMSEDIFGCHNLVWGGTGIWLAQVRGDAQHPIMHRLVPTTRITQSHVWILLGLRNPGLPLAGVLTNVLLRWRVSERTTSVSQFLTLRKRGHLEGLPFFMGDCFPEAGGWRREKR